MTDPQLHTRLSRLFRECEQAHLAAFSATGGEDPEWPLWFADYLQKPLQQALDTEFHKSQLIYSLMNADFEHTARAADTDRVDFFAAEFIEHFAPSDTATADKLALYTMASCPFCWRVTRAIDRLGLEVEIRDVYAQPAWRDELLEARGRASVPVLWIQSPDGSVRWMPESGDIVHYLEHMYGEGQGSE
jgi:glutaredoxin